ncbi:MAG: hypothetical protein QOH55_965 [Microbacteriaceae bacterium]|jgi:hypothetical protein|nr:hypothetical protein [Microbacteriaceae bacterium]
MPKIRKSTSLKFAAVAIGVAGIVGLTISSASSLNLAGGTVAANATSLASCQSTTSAATVNFGTTYSTTGYNVTTVALGNVDPNCHDEQIKVTLSDASGNSLGEFTGTVPAVTNPATAPFFTTITLTRNTATAPTGTISALTVANSSVVIYN